MDIKLDGYMAGSINIIYTVKYTINDIAPYAYWILECIKTGSVALYALSYVCTSHMYVSVPLLFRVLITTHMK